MDYIPWPDSGCSLSEARDRICGDVSAARQCGALDQRDDRLESLKALSNKRLVAVACESQARSKPAFIDLGSLPIEYIDWQVSKLITRMGTYFDVRIFPLLLRPIHLADSLPAPFAEVFKKYLLEDPEVDALARRGMEECPQYRNVFVDGRCTVHGIEQWSVQFEHGFLIGEVHPDPQKRSKFDRPGSHSIEIYLAARALKHRYAALINLLRLGHIEAEGLPSANPNFPTKIPRSIWSHDGFYVDAAGDVYEEDEFSTNKFGLVKRWTSLMLSWNAIFFDQLVRSGCSEMFHVQPLDDDGLPLAATRHAWKAFTRRRLTTLQASIEEAYTTLFSDGSDDGISVQVRDQLIIDWQKKNRKPVASEKSIYRHLKERRTGQS